VLEDYPNVSGLFFNQHVLFVDFEVNNFFPKGYRIPYPSIG